MALNFGQNMFPPRGELINYDYFDISNGTGYDIYYASKSGAGNIMTTTQVFSEQLHTDGGSITFQTAFSKSVDTDFDILFNLPRNIKGDLLMNVPLGVEDDDGVEDNWKYYAILKIYHYDGSTETQIGATQTSTTFWANGLSTGEQNPVDTVAQFKVAIPLTHFGIGETLRFNIEVWGASEAANGDAFIGMGHDPQNRSDVGLRTQWLGATPQVIISAGNTTRMEAHVPFKLDL